MNIIKRELRANLKSTIIWSLAIIFIVALWMVEFESFSGDTRINEVLDSMPSTIMDALGMGNMDLSSVEGFISSIVLYIYLALGIHACLLGSSMLAKEERDKTADYLFTMPIRRRDILTRKLISSLITLISINLISLGVFLATTRKYEKSDRFYKFIGLLFIAVFILQMIFLSIGMLVASINKKYRKSANISVTLLMVMFLIASLVNTLDQLDFLKYISPFKYFDAKYLLNNLKLQPVFLLISIGVIAVGIVGTYIYYPKRDLYI